MYGLDPDILNQNIFLWTKKTLFLEMDGLSNPKEIHTVSRAAKETPPRHKGKHFWGRQVTNLQGIKDLQWVKKICKALRTITFARKNLLAKGPASAGK